KNLCHRWRFLRQSCARQRDAPGSRAHPVSPASIPARHCVKAKRHSHELLTNGSALLLLHDDHSADAEPVGHQAEPLRQAAFALLLRRPTLRACDRLWSRLWRRPSFWPWAQPSEAITHLLITNQRTSPHLLCLTAFGGPIRNVSPLLEKVGPL